MAVFAFVPHRSRPDAAALALEAISWLEQQGHAARVPEPEARETGLEPWAWPEETLGDGLDLAVSVGGDGTMLRTVDLVCGAAVPVLGVNMGQLGYLAEVEPEHVHDALTAFLEGRHRIEERMTLEVDVDVPGEGKGRHAALNEAVLEKTLSGHTVRLAVSINDEFFTTYAADGLIVATPTGSTAYSFSARGPIVSPRHRALLMTPVSPHMLFDRSLVLDASETVRMEVIDGRPAVLVVDGQQVCVVGPGGAVECRAAPTDARLVTFGGRDFHQILKAKFRLADR